jgi:hypothetical protein
VLALQGFHEEAMDSWRVAVGEVGEHRAPPHLRTLALLGWEGPRGYLGFHVMQGGLNNQIQEFAGMVAMANALGRTLVLPQLWSRDFVGREHVLGFDRVFDVQALRRGLAGSVSDLPTPSSFNQFEDTC